jgi:hypothetical protein
MKLAETKRGRNCAKIGNTGAEKGRKGQKLTNMTK